MTPIARRRRATTIVSAVLAAALIGALAVLLLSPARLEQRLPEVVEAGRTMLGALLGPWAATLGGADLVANVVVFVPVGVLAALLLPPRAWPAALLVTPVLSGAVEAVQALALPGRVGSLTDIAAATAGGALGVGIAALCTALTALAAARAETARAAG